MSVGMFIAQIIQPSITLFAVGVLGKSSAAHIVQTILQPSILLFAQITFQLFSLLCVILGASTFFSLLMPRALFGSLLAWVTIVLTYAISLFPLDGSPIIRTQFHTFLVQKLPETVLIGIPILVISFMFIANEVTANVWVKKVALLRGFYSLIIMLGGALFWGMIFSHSIEFLLERPQIPIACSGCLCLIGIEFIGSCLAVLFGILVQLLWQDRNITEPLDEPL